MRVRILALAALLAASSLAASSQATIPMSRATPQPGPPLAVLAAARQQVQTADYRLTGRLVRVEQSGERTSYRVALRARWFPGVLRVRLDVVSPTQAREHVLLEMRPGGKDTILIARPGDAQAAALPFRQWRSGPFGASPGEGFSYEDFLDAQYFWSGQKALGDVKYGARNCDLLLSTPGTSDETHYAAVKSWLDQASGSPVYIEKTLKGSGEMKQFTSFGLRRTEGVWGPSQVEVKTPGQTGSTLLIIDRGTPRAHLDRNDFSAALLPHF